MELDTKQKVLVALYTEYQKDLPDMRNVNYEVMGMEPDVFYVAISKLVTEGYITDAWPIARAGKMIDAYRLDNCKLTRDGIEYVEEKLEIKPNLSGSEKVKEVASKVTKWGYEQFKDVIVKIGAECLKSSIGPK